MNLVTTLFVLLTAVLTASCAQFYTPDLTGPTAQIRFVADAPRYTLVGAMADEQCGTEGNAGRITALGGTAFRHEEMFAKKHQRIGVPGGGDIPMDLMHEINIPAEKNFVFIFRSRVGSYAAGAAVASVVGSGLSTVSTCDLTLSFYPKKDEQYEVVYRFDGVRCGATLEKVVRTASGEVQRFKEDSFKKPTQCKYPGWSF